MDYDIAVAEKNAICAEGSYPYTAHDEVKREKAKRLFEYFWKLQHNAENLTFNDDVMKGVHEVMK